MKKKLFFLNLVISVILINNSFAQLRYWSPEQCLKMKNITSVRPSPDGKKVLYTVREAIMNDERSEYINRIFVCNANGGDNIQLTKIDKNSSNPKWSPAGQWIAYTSDRDGKNNLYILPLNGGESEKITDVKTSVGEFEWSPDGKSIAFVMGDSASAQEDKNKKGKNDWYFMGEEVKQNRLYVLSLNNKDSSGKRIQNLLTKENRNVNNFSWSFDSKWIVYSFGKTPQVGDNINFSDIALVNVSTAESKLIANTGAAESNPKFSLDGKWIAYECSEDPVIWGGKYWIKIIPAEGGTPTALLATPDFQGVLLGWSPDSKYVYVTESNKTLNSIYALRIDSKEITEWTKGIKDLIGIPYLNRNSDYFGFILQNTSTPAEGFVSSVTSFSPQKITNINADVASKPVSKTEVIKWKTSDGKEIEGLLTYPLNYEEGKKYPLILNIHGGPAGVFAQNFIAANQGAYPIATFAEMGYAILRSNPRGSSGYGVEFRLANQRDWGGEDYKDLMAGVDHVIKMGVADANKLGVCGWSYGGFMSSWVIGHTDRFKAASVGAPVVDLISQDLTDDIPGFLTSYMRNDPWNDYDVYSTHSPLRFVENVKTPVLLQHGDADIRVPFSQGVMIYNALKRRNIPVKLLVLPRQPHGPTEPKMILEIMKSNVEWFQKYLEQRNS
ncbi:MAG TPA: S9 family peptidase [Chitinophagaceae bacterium]